MCRPLVRGGPRTQIQTVTEPCMRWEAVIFEIRKLRGKPPSIQILNNLPVNLLGNGSASSEGADADAKYASLNQSGNNKPLDFRVA